MKKLILFLTGVSMVLPALAQNPGSNNTAPWCLDINIKPGFLNQKVTGFNMSQAYPDAVNSNISDMVSKGKTSFGFDVQGGYFFGEERRYGIGTGFMYQLYKSELELNTFHIEYRSTDYKGNVFRQSLTANQAVKETIKTAMINIPVVFKYQVPLSNKWGFAADAGFVFNISNSYKFKSDASFDYEAIYKFENGVAVYDASPTPNENDWLITRQSFLNKNPGGDVEAYFRDQRKKGYNVGLGTKPEQTTGTGSYQKVSVGFCVQPTVTYLLNEKYSLQLGLFYLVQKTSNDNSQTKLTDKTGQYESLARNVNSATNHVYSLNVGVRYHFGKPKDRDKDGVDDKKDLCPDFAGLMTLAGCPDADGDGIADKDDTCPQEAGLATLKGCPDSDNDGITDKEDACPKQAGEVRFNGCPDSDGDGIKDNEDECVNEKGPVATHGCPDSDGDGVKDALDKCASVAGSKEHSGCPDTDNDQVFDDVDGCVEMPGTIANNGCPEVPVAVEVREPFNLETREIVFASGTAVIKKSSYAALDSIVTLMKENPEYTLTISGHTDNTGDSTYNRIISKKRADAVATYLRKKGIEPSRLSTAGFGATQPVDTNNTRQGRARNRRVDMRIEIKK